MRSFRVYNRVRKVGVTWRIAGIEIGMASMTALFVFVAAMTGLVALAAVIGGAAAAVVMGVIGAGLLLAGFVFVSRLVSMGRLNEATQLRLLTGTVRQRRYKNFQTPDCPGDINDDRALFAATQPVYRNF
ncbi:hypothetical protein GS896_25300 [Rhodococcus hoagii]|nr:hypothetical protein [Prescottella equi]MBM4654179.1 hypothetical protein [Prescottella equi]MBM4719651.1 hypothetical protein [Prescottella equi]NKR23450.1 hypothetical protein [Prescottella equi]NKT55938.1 hypothetical protein [Prescottella equi]